MGELPRGHEEPSSTSRDLMARFDMAHDRADRSPEVREYLENLRPQILKLQKELRLQTDEDIAGLEKRGDIDMNQVDKLVGLIEAFRKAWKENAVSPSEARKFLRERAIREAGPAWKDFLQTVAWIENVDGPIDVESKRYAGMAIANAGEPELAWNLFRAAKLFDNISEGSLLAKAAIWKAFMVAGRTPPFEYHQLTLALMARTTYSEDATAFVIEALLRGGRPGDAFLQIHGFSDRRRMLDLLIRSRDLKPDSTSIIDRQIKEVIGEDTALKILACFARGDVASALTYTGYGGRWAPGAKAAVAEGYALVGDARKAFDTDRTIFTMRNMELVGRILVALLDRGDVGEVTSKAQWLEDYGDEVEPAVLSRIIVGLVAHGETKLAQSLSRHLLISPVNTFAGTAAVEQRDLDRPRAILPVVRAFADHGIPTDELGTHLKNLAEQSGGIRRGLVLHLLTEASFDAAVRTLKRAAKQFLASSDRAAWDDVLAEILDDRKDIADQLTYDPTLA